MEGLPTASRRAAIAAFLDAGRWDRAEPAIREALRESPDDAELLADLALCQINTGHAVEARSVLSRALERESNHPFAHYLLGEAVRRGAVPVTRRAFESDESMRRRVARQAELHFLEALRLAPANPDFYAGLAQNHLQAGRTRDAITVAETGLRIDPDHASCQNVLAKALADAGRLTDAQQATLAALRQDPNDAYTHANRGWVLLRTGEHEAAAEHFRSSLREDPASLWARLGLKESIKRRFRPYRTVFRGLGWLGRRDETRSGFLLWVLAGTVPFMSVAALVCLIFFLSNGGWSGVGDVLGMLIGSVFVAVLFGIPFALVVMSVPLAARGLQGAAEYALLFSDDGRFALTEGERNRMFAWVAFWVWLALVVLAVLLPLPTPVRLAALFVVPGLAVVTSGLLSVGPRRVRPSFWVCGALALAAGVVLSVGIAGLGSNSADAPELLVIVGCLLLPIGCIGTVQRAVPAEALDAD